MIDDIYPSGMKERLMSDEDFYESLGISTLLEIPSSVSLVTCISSHRGAFCQTLVGRCHYLGVITSCCSLELFFREVQKRQYRWVMKQHPNSHTTPTTNELNLPAKFIYLPTKLSGI